MLITTWDAAGGGPFAASAIATTGLAKTAEIVQSMFIGPVFNPLLKMLGADKIAIRASLCAAQLVGLGIMRYGVRSGAAALHVGGDAGRRHWPDNAALPGRRYRSRIAK